MSERGAWSQLDEEHGPDCEHCHGPLDSEHESLCLNCRTLADTMAELVLCEYCPTEQLGLETCNSADALADYAVWCRTTGKGVDPIDTFPRVRLGICMDCFATRRLHSWIAEMQAVAR